MFKFFQCTAVEAASSRLINAAGSRFYFESPSILAKKLEHRVKCIEHEALELSEQKRAFLADCLLSSFRESGLTEIESAWIDEAERRYDEYLKGERPGIPANEVFAEAARIDRLFSA